VQHMDAAEAPTGPALGETSLTTVELNADLPAAIDRLAVALSLGADSVAKLRSATVQVGDLPGLGLGITVGDQITISRDAAGWGWFIDPTPYDDSEFTLPTGNGVAATPASPSYGRMDLLTVEMHELEHVLGVADSSTGLMSEKLIAGIRLAPARAAAQVFDSATGTFLGVDELELLRGLHDGLSNPLNASQLPDWVVSDFGGNSSSNHDEELASSHTPKLSASTNGVREGHRSPDNGNIGSAVISWNKSFVGFGSGKLRSLL
jgi:hypothetical protein